jgi:hypothetical protein
MAAARRGSPSRPPVRLRAVPPLDPPFDDEAAPAWTTGLPGQLALDFTAGTRPPADSRPPSGARPGSRRPSTALDPLPPPALPAASAEARQAARRFLVICLEIFNGYRGVSHVRALTDRSVHYEVVRQLTTGLERLTTLRRRTVGRGQPVRIRRVRICEPRSGAVEAAVVLDIGGHVWAAAFRVERRHGSWVATALHLL